MKLLIFIDFFKNKTTEKILDIFASSGFTVFYNIEEVKSKLNDSYLANENLALLYTLNNINGILENLTGNIDIEIYLLYDNPVHYLGDSLRKKSDINADIKSWLDNAEHILKTYESNYKSAIILNKTELFKHQNSFIKLVSAYDKVKINENIVQANYENSGKSKYHLMCAGKIVKKVPLIEELVIKLKDIEYPLGENDYKNIFNQNKSLKFSIQSISQEKAELQHKLQETVKSGNQKIAELTKTLEEKNKQLAARAAELDLLKKSIEEKTKALNDLKTQANMQKTNSEDAMNKLSLEHAEKVKELEIKFASLNEQLKTVSMQRTELQQKLEENVKSGNQKIAELTKFLEEKNKQLSGRTDELDLYKKSVEEKIKALNDLKTQANMQKTQSEDAMNKLSLEHAGKIKELEIKFASLNEQLKTASLQKTELQQKLEENVKSGNLKISELAKSVEEKNKQLSGRAAELDLLKKAAEEKTKSLEELKIKSEETITKLSLEHTGKIKEFETKLFDINNKYEEQTKSFLETNAKQIEYQKKQRLLEDEVIKAESQLELIKEFLIPKKLLN